MMKGFRAAYARFECYIILGKNCFHIRKKGKIISAMMHGKLRAMIHVMFR